MEANAVLAEIKEKTWRGIVKANAKTTATLDALPLEGGLTYWEREQNKAEAEALSGKPMDRIKTLLKKFRSNNANKAKNKEKKKALTTAKKAPDFVPAEKKSAEVLNTEGVLKLEELRKSITDDFKRDDWVSTITNSSTTAIYDPRILLCSISYPNFNTRVRGMTYNPTEESNEPGAGDTGYEDAGYDYKDEIRGAIDAYDRKIEGREKGVPESLVAGAARKSGEWQWRKTERTFAGGLIDSWAEGNFDVEGFTDIPQNRVSNLTDEDRRRVLTNPILDMSEGSVNRIYPLPPPLKDDPSTWGLDEKGLDMEGQFGYGLELVLREYTSDYTKKGEFSEASQSLAKRLSTPYSLGYGGTQPPNRYITKTFKIAFNTGSDKILPPEGETELSDKQLDELFRKWEKKRADFYALIPTKFNTKRDVNWLGLEDLKNEVEGDGLPTDAWFSVDKRYEEEVNADPDWTWTIGSKGGYLYGSDPTAGQKLGGAGLLHLSANQTQGIRQLPPILVHIENNSGCVFIKYKDTFDYLGQLKYTMALGVPQFERPPILTHINFMSDHTHLGHSVFQNEILMLRGHGRAQINGVQYGLSSGINMTIDHLNYRTRFGDYDYHEELIDLHRTYYHFSAMTQEDIVNKVIRDYWRHLKPLFIENNPDKETTANGTMNTHTRNSEHRPEKADVYQRIASIETDNEYIQGISNEIEPYQGEMTRERFEVIKEQEEIYKEWEAGWKEQDPTRMLWLRHLGHGFYTDNLLQNDDVANIYWKDDEMIEHTDAYIAIIGRGRPSHLGLDTQYERPEYSSGDYGPTKRREPTFEEAYGISNQQMVNKGYNRVISAEDTLWGKRHFLEKYDPFLAGQFGDTGQGFHKGSASMKERGISISETKPPNLNIIQEWAGMDLFPAIYAGTT